MTCINGRRFSWIRPEPAGLRIVPADVWIDPARAVGTALVTHGHADHARGGHGRTIATPETLAIMALRYGVAEGAFPAPLHAPITLPGGVTATFVPAGHVLGSAQILLEHAGERVVVTGDYKRRPDPTCPPFAVTPCDLFITEATFGLPVFRHPPIGQEIARLLAARAAQPDRCVLVGAYALGKAQRVIAELRAAGFTIRSGCMARWSGCAACTRNRASTGRSAAGVRCAQGRAGRRDRALPALGAERPLEPAPARSADRHGLGLDARAPARRQRNVELPLIISDHADWDELTATIAQVNPAETWITHGREEALLRWCELHQRKARALALVGYEDEDD
jgi:putative mRNA 3-end processing factor